MRLITTAVPALALLLALTACSGSDPEPDPAPEPEVTTSASSAADAEGIDRTAAAQETAGDVVTKATEDAGGWLFVETSLTDAGDPAEAIDVCTALVDAGYVMVNVRESDGTTYVIAGHPSYGESCTAV